MSASLRYPIGQSDFQRIREDGSVYIDKTWMIHELLENRIDAILLPRPRRFGKTLALSMLRYFFEKTDEDLSRLFRGLRIQESKLAAAHFQKYPVISISFKRPFECFKSFA